MNFRLVATLACVISLPYGLAFLIDPSAPAHLYGAGSVDRHLLQLGRYFGAEILMYAAAAWAARGASGEAQRGAAAGLAAATACGLVVTLHGLSAGALNALGWSSAALYAAFTLCWLRLALLPPTLARQAA